MVAQQQHPVMIVDDDPDLLQLMSTTLRNNGFQVVARTSPPNWLELGQADPAMIFMDVDLGRANGANLCKSIKENLPQWKLPIVLVSGHPEEQLSAEAKYAHADDSIHKPFRGSTLVRMAKRYARKAA